MADVGCLAPWFGSNRLLSKQVGEELAGCPWVGVPFAGGMSELCHLTARTLLVNDLHRHVINLARVISDDSTRSELLHKLDRTAFHPDTLVAAQAFCREAEPDGPLDLYAAEAYFVCCWMGRSSNSGIDDEFKGRPAIRWNASGGDSAVRFRSALRSMAQFGRIMRRCTFETMDVFDFLTRCEDADGHGLYLDPPFPKLGRRYRHNAGATDAEERAWHTQLRDAVVSFCRTRVVLRFYEHPLIEELYPRDAWTWRELTGRDQANNGAKPELLLINGPSRAVSGVRKGLF